MVKKSYELLGKKVFIPGSKGMVGSALVRRLQREGCFLITTDRRSLELTNQKSVLDWMKIHKPEVIFLAAARVGGIMANARYPVPFLYDNLMIEANVIEAAHQVGCERLIFLGSSCIYPKLAQQPIQEESLLTGPLEETNQWYAIAKIAGLKLVEAFRKQYGCDYISVMPTNLYGPGDTYDKENSHVIPSLIVKFHEAKLSGASSVTLWGTGKPYREFMHVDDLADAVVFLSRHYSGEVPINIGSGEEVSIRELAERIASITGFTGTICFDDTKPDGTPRKLLDSRRLLDLGWEPQIRLEKGLRETYASFLRRTDP